jgi:hypothetical protein
MVLDEMQIPGAGLCGRHGNSASSFVSEWADAERCLGKVCCTGYVIMQVQESCAFLPLQLPLQSELFHVLRYDHHSTLIFAAKPLFLVETTLNVCTSTHYLLQPRKASI